MTITEKLLAYASKKEKVYPGEIIEADLDIVMGNDITAPVAISEMEKAGLKIASKEKIVLVMDHFAPNKDIKSAEQCAVCRNFARNNEIVNFFDTGKAGIEHALLPEQGIVGIGDIIIGADSHTCTYGALGAFSTGVGSTDMAVGMATSKAWFRIPETIRVNFSGKFKPFVSGKDVILTLISILGVDGARYMALEFGGDLSGLSMDDRFTIANMAIEAGAKNGVFEVDDITLSYAKEHGNKVKRIFKADKDAVYARVIDIDLSKIESVVACPHLPSNVKSAKELTDIKIDQVIIGSCTNGRYSDLKVAADILKGKKVADYTRVIIIPATQEIYLQALKDGIIETFIKSGCAVSTPTCGPCLGGFMGILAEGERCVATTNRNFVGRMGHTKSEVYLASPATAAYSALKGYITAPGGKM